MDNIIFLFALFVALELFESNWQKSDSLYGIIYNNYLVYQKSFFNFLILNPSFFYVLFLTIYLNLNSFLMYVMIVIKFTDVAFRISIIKKLNDGIKLEEIITVNIKMGFFYRYLNVIIYPITFLIAINEI